MNNRAGRAEAGQQSHPLPPDGHKTNALLWDKVWPVLDGRQELPEGGDWLTAQPRESGICLFITAPNYLSKSRQMQQPGSTFVMTTCFIDTLISPDISICCVISEAKTYLSEVSFVVTFLSFHASK